ncbi:MAG: type IV pilus biogenesis/stability protein PilW [Endozoicomonadaceae bacterium]|nr:type IV pilus biogenesis/stability protein PilW [Endozoicomonadaceae bacterium]MCY4328761.1 type IV pilus biogenesis/stability protein PilW [Endozoicomonadaceae bacterium]
MSTKFLNTFLKILLFSASLITITGCIYHADNKNTQENTIREEENIQLAAKYLVANQPLKAISRLEKLLSHSPFSSNAYGLLGVIYQQQGEFALAEKNFEKALRLNPSSSEIRNNYGAMLYTNKRFKEAARQFHLASQNAYYKNRDRVFENLGKTYLRMEKMQKAVDYYKHALRLNSERSDVKLSLVKIFLQQKNLSEAERYYNDFLARDRESAQSLWLGIQLAYKMNYSDKLTEYGNRLSKHYAGSTEYIKYQNLISSKMQSNDE